MAFFSAVSSSIGKKLLLYGLRHIDILDKDPADFVSVDVGKRTTLEVRDVGLHVKKLVALLHLKLPPEVHLSKARASLLRVTLVLEFGVPQIFIEMNGIQVHARLAEDSSARSATPPKKQPGSPGPQAAPFRRRAASSKHPAADSGSESDGAEEEHVLTLDELAKSFMKEEPDEEIRELEQELNTHSDYLQDSISSSDDGEEPSAGIGAPLGLPAYLRNILNTALDRLHIAVNNIDIEVEDQFPTELPVAAKDDSEAFVSLNFHIESIAIDSVTARDPQIEVDASTALALDPESTLGQRRMRVQNICARLISDADKFASMSRTSRPPSSADARSDLSSGPSSQSEPSASHISTASTQKDIASSNDSHDRSTRNSLSDLTKDRENDLTASVSESYHSERSQLAVHEPISDHTAEKSSLVSSVLTTDDDRFADAASDDDLSRSGTSEPVVPSRHSSPHADLSASSILYDDDGLLDYAMQNELLDSRLEESFDEHASTNPPRTDALAATSSTHEAHHLATDSASSVSGLLTVSALARSSDSLPKAQSPSHYELSGHLDSSAQHHDTTQQENANDMSHSVVSEQSSSSLPPPDDDLSESKLFTHDDAESMYMSALSAASIASSHQPHVPGGWGSASSNSSHDTELDISYPIPEAMVAGSIIGRLPEGDDGCETPRPGSPQSVNSSPLSQRAATSTGNLGHIPVGNNSLRARFAKTFLTVNEITVWFPLGLGEEHKDDSGNEELPEASVFDFKPPNIGEDSIFSEMPGSFSNYAHSTSRRNPSVEEAARRRPELKTQPVGKHSSSSKMKPSADITVEVGSIAAHIDLSTGRTMFQLIDRLLKAVSSASKAHGGTSSKDLPKVQEGVPGTQSKAELTIKNIGVAWLDRLSIESNLEGKPCRVNLELRPLEAILRVNLSSVRLIHQSLQTETRTKVHIGKCILSSLGQDIIAFRASKTKPKRSVNNSPEGPANDVEIDFEQSKDSRITIVTRPLVVNLDLQQLDDALGSFGGFSGILELGSSITSNNTIGSPVMSPAQPRSKGVHFGDTPLPRLPDTKPAVSGLPKVDVRFGEIELVLKGRSCAVQIQTTSVRAALRKSNLRMKVAEAILSGPHIDDVQSGAPLLVEIRGTTVNFVFVPEEVDLTRLISMITPSKDPYENDEDILIDTLLRQRRKGSVLRAEVASVGVRVSDLTQLQSFETLGTEIAKLSKVAKYLPDDDRPGILTLASVQHLSANVLVNDRIGDVAVSLRNAAIAHVGVPALLAVEVGKASVRQEDEVLLHEVVELRSQDQLPMIMLRMVGDEMEPIIKAKLFNACAEYRVSAVMAALGLSDDGTADDIALGLASSVATITGGSSPKTLSRQTSQSSSPTNQSAKPLQIDLLLRNCAVGLNPRIIASKGLFVLTDAHVLCKQGKSSLSVIVELRKASIHAIDDIARLEEIREPPTSSSSGGNRHLLELNHSGYVSLSTISAAKVVVTILGDGKEQPQFIDVEFKNELFVLESCADSTQTLIAILNGLQPPTPPSTAERYRTVVPLQQMMESFTGDAVVTPENNEEENFMDNADLVADEVPTNLEFVGSFYNPESLPSSEDLGDSMLGEDDLGALATPPSTRQRGQRGLLESFQEQYEVAEDEQGFDFSGNYFKDSDSESKGKARKWDSAKNQYSLTNEFKTPGAPLKVRVRDVNVIWNLYDGYDWPRTRSIISQAVEDVEARAEERRRKPREEDEDEDFVEEDFLFNSVWIGVPIKDEKGALARRINRDIDDLASETGSYATSTATRSTGATVRPRSVTKPSRRRLKLERSKHKKIAFQLMGVALDLVVYPPDSGETQNSVDLRIHDFEIYDHVPSSTWKKFVTCLIEPSRRELSKAMIDLELLTVKPVTELAASELVIRVTVLPLRLHVDQDALDFITRFFEFKDDSALESSGPSDQPFIQRLEVNSVTLKLDYKPKRVDYGGLRSGHTTEFMNFLVLEGADIVLRHAIVYGITSFDKLHNTLNDVWMPDVKRNQLPGVLSGLAAVRPLVNVGSGVRDLVVVPMREYKKDGRIVRSLQKGVYAFARNTTSEVARLGAKVAIGTQNILEGAENFMNPQTGSPGRSSLVNDWDGEDPSSDSEEPRAVSNYANQPIGVKAGLQSAVRYLERDLLTARDAVIAIPAEIIEEGTGAGMAKAIVRRAPTVILRPALGATKAVSHALMGVSNALDPESRRKIDDKYKSR